MRHKIFFTVLFLAIIFPVVGLAYPMRENVVDVKVVSDSGADFAKYRTYPQIRQEGKYFYMEAIKGEKYSVRVENRSNQRIGVVIAVDGRNIISGEKSDLKGSERMYIIDPYVTHTFEGWRTGMDRTNRFYFTEQSDSYAERVFADGSAMGTIALAVYRERVPVRIPQFSPEQSKLKAPSAGAAPSAPSERNSSDRLGEAKSEQAGTGFGETTYSPSRLVDFKPESLMAEKIVLKYEWQSELCKKGVISCGPKNRLWPDGRGFAPIPKDFRG
jgi:hypothetical protein